MLFAGFGVQLYAQDCKDIPAKIPGVYVQDHAGKLSPAEEAAIEQKIQAYRQKTNVQICVALLDNVGEFDAGTYTMTLGNCYGVGEAGVDNGVVIMMSWDRNWSIQTGYGTESYLTDYETNAIGENVIVPNLRANKVFDAVNQSVDACIEQIGWESWPERQAAIRRAEQERADSIRSFFTWVGIIAVALLTLLLIVRIYRREQRRKKVRACLNSWEERLTLPRFDATGWPNWAKTEFVEGKNKFDLIYERFQKEKENILDRLAKIEEAEQLLESLEFSALSGLDGVLNTLNAIPGRIKQYQDEAKGKVQAVLNANRQFLSNQIAEAEKGGLNFKILKGAIEAGIRTLEHWMKGLKNPQADHYRTAFEAAAFQEKMLNGHAQTLAQTLANYTTINQQAANWQKRTEELRRDILPAKVMEQLRSNYPNEVWETLYKGLQGANKDLQIATENLQSAQKKNSLQVQDLTGAWADYESASSLIAAVEKLFTDITTTLESQKTSEAAYAGKKTAAASAISNARSKCSDSDVEGTAKACLREAEGLYQNAASVSGKANWVALCSTLDNAKSKAEEAYRRAVQDIDDAEEERAAARRRAAAAAAASYSSSSSSSSSSSGSSFGGGSFGGGGSSGKW